MGNIRVIGPRSSGKTTYLAALAYWPDRDRLQSAGKGLSSRIKLNSLNEETRELARKAENIILQGESLPPGDVQFGIDGLPFYSFGIEIKPKFKKPELITVAVRDYPGEIFDELSSASATKPEHKEFIEECLEADVDGCLILISGWGDQVDYQLIDGMTQFIQHMKSHGRLHDLRLAIAMSKCERGELWPGRLDPQVDLFQRHLPKTKAVLEKSIPPKNLRFYALSTFGVIDRNDPRPNREDVLDAKEYATLREPRKWSPYGLIEPLYWLSKGGTL